MQSKPDHNINIKRIRTPEEFYLLQEKWNFLLSESPANSFFLRWEWLGAWWKAYQDKDYELCILLAFRGNELIGIAPFYLIYKSWKNIFPIRRLLFLGTKEGNLISEFMDIIHRDGEEEAVTHEIFKFIVSEDLCDDLALHNICTLSKTISVLQQIAKERKFLYIVNGMYESPYINLPANYNDFLSRCSKKLRYNIKNNQKMIVKYDNIVFRKTNNLLELESDFAELIRLHEQRWESRQLAGAFAGERFFSFQKMVMQDMLRNGHLELRFLSVSGKNIAAVYNINYKGKIYFFQAGLDLSFDKDLSPGLLLHSYCIEEAIKDGLKEYDFLLMGNDIMDSYKKRWTKDYRHECDIYMARPGAIKLMMSVRNKTKKFYHALKRKIKFAEHEKTPALQ